MEKILLTGGGGFVGTRLTRMLIDTGYSVDIVDKMGYAFRRDFHQLNSDVQDNSIEPKYSRFFPLSIQKFVVQPDLYDHVIVLHAESHVDNSIKSGEVFFEDNVIGTIRLLESIKNFDKKPNTLLFSTDEVLGETFRPSGTEAPVVPRNPYSASKAAQEMAMIGYGNTFNIPYAITRCTNIYGPGQHQEKFIPKSISNLLLNLQIPLYGVGAESRQWIYIDDICNGVLSLLKTEFTNKTYHFAGDHYCTNKELARLLCKKLNKDPTKYIKYVENRKGHDSSYCLDPEPTKLELGWNAKTSIDEGLDKTIDFYRFN